MSDRADAIMRRIKAVCPNFHDIETEVAALETDLFLQAAEAEKHRTYAVLLDEVVRDLIRRHEDQDDWTNSIDKARAALAKNPDAREAALDCMVANAEELGLYDQKIGAHPVAARSRVPCLPGPSVASARTSLHTDEQADCSAGLTFPAIGTAHEPHCPAGSATPRGGPLCACALGSPISDARPLPNIRELNRASPASVNVRFVRDITNEEVEAVGKAYVAAQRNGLSLVPGPQPITNYVNCERHKGIPYTFTCTASYVAVRSVCPHCNPPEVPSVPSQVPICEGCPTRHACMEKGCAVTGHAQDSAQ